MIQELMDDEPFAHDREHAFRLAIVRARERGPPEGVFMVGDSVIIDGITAQLKIREIHGDEAVVWIDGDESSTRTVEYEDLIDMAVLVDECVRALKEVRHGSPDHCRH